MVPAYKPAELTTAIFVVNVYGHGLEPVTEKSSRPGRWHSPRTYCGGSLTGRSERTAWLLRVSVALVTPTTRTAA
jgi:hypothetical protein